MSYLLALLGFMALIVLHELGHMLTAKAVGMRVERFALFFGPKYLLRYKRGDTEYLLGTIPLGGFVKITGMTPVEQVAPEHQARAYVNQPVWKRIVVIAAGPAVNIVLALFLFAAVFGFNGTAESSRAVAQVNPGSPATGLLAPGDRLLAVDGVQGSPDRLRAQISRHGCLVKPPVAGCTAAEPARLTVERKGERREVLVRPVYDAQAGRPLVGFAFGQQQRDYTAPQAVREAADTMWTITTTSVDRILGVFDAEKRKDIGGVVGGYKQTQEGIEVSTATAVFILAAISLSLGIINLFPFLPLDGGHILWSLVEKVRGKAVPWWVIERASVLGFALVIVFAVIGLTNDIDRLTGEGFGVR